MASRLLHDRKAKGWTGQCRASRYAEFAWGAFRFLSMISSFVGSRSARAKERLYQGVQTGDSGDFRERAIAVVREHDVSRVAVPGVIAADEFVDGIPASRSLRRGRVFGRFRDYLPQRKPARSSDAARRYIRCHVQVRKAVVVEITEIGTPRPASHLHPRLMARLRTCRLPDCDRAHCRARAADTGHDSLRSILVKLLLLRNALACRFPHAGNINALVAAVS